MLSPNQVPPQIEQVIDGSMGSYESQRLPHRLETPHSALSNPRRLMGLLCSIILILPDTVDRLRNKLPVSNPIATQFVRHDLPGLAAMRS